MNEVVPTHEAAHGGKEIYTHFQVGPAEYVSAREEAPEIKRCCAIHPEYPIFYVCLVCGSMFCRFCPASQEGGSKACPFCGGQCGLVAGEQSKSGERTIAKYDDQTGAATETAKPEIKTVSVKLYFTDFITAMKYPFNFPISLIAGAVLFFILIFGQIILVFGGGWAALFSLVVFAVMMMLKFGVLFKTIENFTRANFREGFLPRVKKFTIFEDFLNPLIASIGVYTVSFGLFILIAVSLGMYAWFAFAEDTQTIEDEMRLRGTQINSTLSANESDKTLSKMREMQLKEMIDQARLRQFESVFGHNHLLESEQLGKFVKSVLNLTITYQMPLFFAFILGFLYFPAVCMTLDKNRSFWEILQFRAALREIRSLGFDYIKIVLLSFGFIVILLSAAVGLYSIFNALEFPVVGILSALIAASFLFFYFWLVTSAIVGMVICKRNENFDRKIPILP